MNYHCNQRGDGFQNSAPRPGIKVPIAAKGKRGGQLRLVCLEYLYLNTILEMAEMFFPPYSISTKYSCGVTPNCK